MKTVYTQVFRLLDDAELFAERLLLQSQGASVQPHVEIWPTGAAYILTVRF